MGRACYFRSTYKLFVQFQRNSAGPLCVLPITNAPYACLDKRSINLVSAGVQWGDKGLLNHAELPKPPKRWFPERQCVFSAAPLKLCMLAKTRPAVRPSRPNKMIQSAIGIRTSNNREHLALLLDHKRLFLCHMEKEFLLKKREREKEKAWPSSVLTRAHKGYRGIAGIALAPDFPAAISGTATRITVQFISFIRGLLLSKQLATSKARGEWSGRSCVASDISWLKAVSVKQAEHKTREKFLISELEKGVWSKLGLWSSILPPSV